MRNILRMSACFLMVFSIISSLAVPAFAHPIEPFSEEAFFLAPEKEPLEDRFKSFVAESINGTLYGTRSETASNGSYDKVPLYWQDNYPNTVFSQGTVASSGCGVTCLAMVATYLTDTKYLPDECAEHYNVYGESNAARMEYGIVDLKLPFVGKIFNWYHLIDALESGKIAIALMTSESIFTTFGHFIVLTGITEDGKILVNDPNKCNYTNLADDLKNGFDGYKILQGFSGAWVFEKGAESDFSDLGIYNAFVTSETGKKS